uniref:Uncharacterized protein n=1 Tax=Ditylenchus dipsaci TaxID=166011 RepID=A0A915DNW9_9BILA
MGPIVPRALTAKAANRKYSTCSTSSQPPSLKSGPGSPQQFHAELLKERNLAVEKKAEKRKQSLVESNAKQQKLYLINPAASSEAKNKLVLTINEAFSQWQKGGSKATELDELIMEMICVDALLSQLWRRQGFSV